MLKIIFSIGIFMLATMSEAASIKAQKKAYPIGESVTVTVSSMLGETKDWVGIYPAGATNDWDNVISWQWTGNITNGDVILNGIPNAGNYEARAFFNNSFKIEAAASFAVSNATLSMQKDNYDEGETISVSITKMLGNNSDWVGIYPTGASNDWNNVISWDWTGGVINGDVTLMGIATPGSYEARAFFKNNYNMVASQAFTVGKKTTLSTEKKNYNIGEAIAVSVTNMLGDSQDWVGIYPAGASNDWDNVISWDWTGGFTSGDVILNGVLNAGNYEARVFFENSYNIEAIATFTVGEQFGEKGNHAIAVKALDGKAFIYYPTDLNGTEEGI